MKKTVLKAAIHIGIVGIVFIASLFFFNQRIASEKGGQMAELSNASYPMLEIASEAGDYNLMSAYRGEIDLSLVRSQLTIVDHSKTIGVKLHNYNYDITAIQYVLFEKTEDEPLEEGTLNRLTDVAAEGVRTGEITLTSDLEQGKNYYLKMAVRLDNSTRAYFYTKVQNGAGYHLSDYMTFALDFHEKLFDKTAVEEISPYLETSADASGTNLYSVDIQSSADTVTFGNMEVSQVSDPTVRVKELNGTYAVLELSAVVSSEISSGVVQYYKLDEIYKLRYTAERMYLLDYQRSMGAYYNESVIDSANNYLGLGIRDGETVSYLSADEGYKVCFVEEGELWYYDYQSSNVSKVYSFSSDNLADLHNSQDEHGIRLLKMDEDGSILYLVCGYMSRGKHEGLNGVEIMYFDAESNCNEELAFLTSSVPYDTMEEDLGVLAFLNESNVFYCLLDGDLHKVDLTAKTDEILKSGVVNDSLTASKDQSIIAIETEENVADNREITMIDLETGESRSITCKKNERIRAVGFLTEDFIYGTAKASDVTVEENGAVTFPMKTLHIVDMAGNEKKTYEPTGKRYVMETTVSGSVLEMSLGKKKGKTFTETGATDYIRYKESETEDAVSLVYDASEPYGNQLYFQFPEYVYIQVEPDLVLTKILTSEDDRNVELGKSGETTEQYTVYAGGVRQGVFTALAEAVAQAEELRGNVIDSSENTLWECAFADYAKVSGMDEVTKVSSDAKSLAACLVMIARSNGTQATVKGVDTAGKSVTELLAQYSGKRAFNLTGCTVDSLLYYISKGEPVLAKYSASRYVIVMSYNSTKLRYLDPVTGLSTAVDREALTETLAQAGNEFYTCLPD